MKKSMQRGLAACLIIAMMLIGACSKQPSGGISGTQGEEGSKAMGRYLEESVPLPDGMTSVSALARLADGTIRMLCTDAKEGMHVFDSKDNGLTFKEAEGYSEILEEAGFGPQTGTEAKNSGSFYASTSAISREGALLINKQIFSTGDGSEENTSLDSQWYYISSDLKLKQIPVTFSSTEEIESYSQMPNSSGFTAAGELLVSNITGELLQINPETEEVLHTYQDCLTTFCIGTTLYAVTSSGIDSYDTTTGQLLAADSVLNDFYKNAKGETSNGVAVSTVGSGALLMASGKEDGSVYYLNSTGLYRHVKDGTAMEQIINGSLVSFSSPDTSLAHMTVNDDGTFLISAYTRTGMQLYRYAYSDQVSAMPEKELKVYSLTDSMTVRQSIAAYQKQHPDTFVSLEIGMSGDDAVTASDALRTLNTNIMAGKGPDVLILDGMPIDSYIEKGMLADLSGLLDEIEQSDGLFENIARAYEKNGQVNAVPTGFQVPILQGSTASIEQVSDLASLGDLVSSLRESNPDKSTILTRTDSDDLLNLLYPVCAPAWFLQDGTIDESKLKEFLTVLKKIGDAEKAGTGQEEPDQTIVFVGGGGLSSNTADALMGLFDYLYGNRVLNAGAISSVNDLSYIISANDSLGLSYVPMNGQASNVYIPRNIVGINARSGQIGDAQDFIRAFLSKENQLMSTEGFPVNRAAFDQACDKEENQSGDADLGSLSVSDAASGEATLTIHWPSKEQLNEFRAILTALNTPCAIDSTVLDAVRAPAGRYLDGSIDLDTAVSDIMQKINLYLSE